MNNELELALGLAREAGEWIVDVYRHGFTVEHKGSDGPVTEADRGADRLIVAGLRREFPADAILSEESPDDLSRLEHARLWLVDPLDGTRQFVAGIDEFAVMIGLAVEGQGVLGVVHLPIEDRTVYAARGLGAFELRGGSPPRRLSLPEEAQTDPGPVVALSRMNASSRTLRVAQELGAQLSIPSGSVGRKALLVATGEADAYFSLAGHSRHWDACAPQVIVEEAGGIFTDTRGEPLVYNTEDTRNADGLLACRAGLHRRVIETIARERQDPR